MTDLVSTSAKDGILTIRMNRPDKKNALNLAMYSAMAKAITDADKNPDIRVIVIAGAKGSFCAGNDLHDFIANPPVSEKSPVYKFLNAITKAELPLVAAVDGIAVGVGVTMLLHCDFVYISETSRLSLPFVNLGLVPEAGSSMLLPRLAGHQRAAELLMLGEPFTPKDALEIGIANSVCKSEDVEKIAMITAQKLSEKPRNALRQTKALMRREFESVSQRIAAEGDVFKKCLGSPETKEAIAAFKEQRKPKFS